MDKDKEAQKAWRKKQQERLDKKYGKAKEK